MARIAGINIPQNKVVSIALTYIHGIGPFSSKKICEKLSIPSSKRVNELTEEQVLKIREFIDNEKIDIYINHPRESKINFKSTKSLNISSIAEEFILQKRLDYIRLKQTKVDIKDFTD